MNQDDNAKLEKKKNRDLYGRCVRSWSSLLKSIQLYSPEHPSSKESAQNTVALIIEAFKNNFEFKLEQQDGLFIVDQILLIEESLFLYGLLKLLESRGIMSVLFLPGLTAEEMMRFCIPLTTSTKGLNAVEKNVPGTEHIQVMTETEEVERTRKSIQLKMKTSVEEAQRHYHEWLRLTDAAFAKLFEDQTFALPEFFAHLDRLIDGLSHSVPVYSVLVLTESHSQILVQHSVNTLIYSLYLGLGMGYEGATLKILGVAAFLHDIGRTLLPSEFGTGYRLSPGNADLIHAHCREGSSFLAGVGGLPMSAIRAALEHHIGYDGQGYPHLPTQQTPHPFSQIIGIADFLSWRTTSESYYHKPVSPQRLVRSLIRRSGTQFDPLLVKVVLPFLGIYPTGSKIILSTQEQGVALLSNPMNITRPAIVVGKNGKPEGLWLAPSVGQEFEKMPSITGSCGQYPNPSSLLALLPAAGEPLA